MANSFPSGKVGKGEHWEKRIQRSLRITNLAFLKAQLNLSECGAVGKWFRLSAIHIVGGMTVAGK